MAILTAEQANKLANNFAKIAEEIGNYRYQHHNTLSGSERERLKELHHSALNNADDLYTLSATLVMDDVATSVDAIQDITDKIATTYRQLQNVQKVIDIAASSVGLASSIISKNPIAIRDSIAELADKLN